MASKRRDPGDWSVSERSGRKGQWQARKQFGRKNNGKPNIIALYGRSKKEVKEKAKEYEAMLITNQIVKIPNKTVYDYVKNWLKTVKIMSVKPKTYDGLEDALEIRLKPYDLANTHMKNVSAENCQAYINQLANSDKNYSLATISKSYSLLNCAFIYAVQKKNLYTNPMELVELPSEATLETKTKEITFLTEEQLEKIFEEVSVKYANGKPHYYYGLIIEILARTGIRKNEALALLWEDVDLKNMTININKTLSNIKNRNSSTESDKKRITVKTYPKTKKSARIVKLSKKAAIAFENLKSQAELYGLSTGPKDNVFQTQTGNVVSDRNVQRTLDYILINLGIYKKTEDKNEGKRKEQHYSLHSLRHTFATILLLHGVDINVVSALLGHEKVSTTYNIYIHVIEAQKTQALDMLDNIL